MSNLDKIYFNHIPKTAGSFFITNIKRIMQDANIQYKRYFIGDIDNIEINKMINSDLIVGHFGIQPHLYLENLSTLTMLRDPVSRVVSNYCMIYQEDNLNVVNNFNNWLFNDEVGYLTKNNLQSRFLTNKRMLNPADTFTKLLSKNLYEIEKEHQKVNEEGFAIENKNLKYLEAKKYLDSCELVMISENISTDINKFFKLINNKWNINIQGKTEPWGESLKSKKLRTLLNKKQIDKIISLNEIDIELYEYSKILSSRFSI